MKFITLRHIYQNIWAARIGLRQVGPRVFIIHPTWYIYSCEYEVPTHAPSGSTVKSKILNIEV